MRVGWMRTGVLAVVVAGILAGPAIAIEKEPTPLFWDALEEAEWGNPQAQYAVGMMYLKGADVEKNDAEAARWLEEAAKQGDSRAQLKLGELYETGIGVPQDKNLAAELYRKAAQSTVSKDDQYYQRLEAVHLQKIQQEHERELERQRQKAAQQMQKSQQKHQEQMARKYYNRGSTRYRGRTRSHRYRY